MTNEEYDRNVAENLGKTWYVQECGQPDCWCLMITTNLSTDDMESCIVAAGGIPREYARHVVRLHNEELVAMETRGKIS